MYLENEFDKIEKALFNKMESEPLRPLVHYTSAMGLKGILLEKELWFSDYEFMNDKSEGRHIYNVLYDTLCEFDVNFANEVKKQLFVQDISGMTTDEHFSPSERKIYSKYTRPKDRIFICCFSKNSDCLPMWNYYTKNPSSIGYNLVFNSHSLIASIYPKEAFYFIPHICDVIYDKKTQYRIMSKILSSYYKLWQENTTNRYEIIERLTFLIDDIRFLFKNPAFKHEDEIRIILRVSEQNFNTAVEKGYVSVRENAGYFIPYIKLNCISENTVECITISPTNNSEAA